MTTLMWAAALVWFAVYGGVLVAVARKQPKRSGLPKRQPLPPLSLDELADDMQVICPSVLADIFFRENANRIPR